MRRAVGGCAWLFLILAGCRPSGHEGTVFVDPALLSLVPSDTVFLGGARMDALAKTPTYQKHFSSVVFPGAEAFVQATGVDPQRDLWQLLAASNGKQFVWLVRGRFSNGGAEPRLNLPNSRRLAYKGYAITGNDAFGLAFLNASTAVAGGLDAVKLVLDGRERSGPTPALMALLRTVPRQAQLWAVGLGPLPELGAVVPKDGAWINADKLFASLRSFALYADLSSGLELHARGLTASDEEAQRLTAAMKGLVGFARLSTPSQDAELLRAWDAVKVRQDGPSAQVEATMDQALLEQLWNFIGSSRRRPPNPSFH